MKEDALNDEITEEVEGVFAVDAAPRVRSRNVSGETRIAVGEDGTVRIQATKRVHGSSPEKAKRLLQNVEVRMEQHGNLIEVKPHLYEQDRGWLDLFRGGRVSVDLVITVPRQSAIEAHTVSGELALDGTRGALEIQSISGDVTINDVQGPLSLRSVSGDVSCSGFAGRAEANTVSGDLRFERCRVHAADIVTVSGDLELVGELDQGDEHRFKTISGDIDLALAGDAYEIGYKTMSGDVILEAEGRVTRDGRRDRTIVIGEPGGARVVVKTVSGDLTVRSTTADVPEGAGPEAAGPPAPPPPRPDAGPAAAGGVRDILERLARGELDVDGAAAELDSAKAFRLLRALGDIPDTEPRPPAPQPPPREPAGEALPPGLKGRILRIQVLSGGKNKVNIAIPLSLARMGKVKMGASGLVKGHLAKFGIDLDELLKTVERSGPIVDVSDNEDRVLIVVE